MGIEPEVHLSLDLSRLDEEPPVHIPVLEREHLARGARVIFLGCPLLDEWRVARALWGTRSSVIFAQVLLVEGTLRSITEGQVKGEERKAQELNDKLDS